MSINQRQFDQLTEMGISLWQNKSTSDVQENVSQNNVKLVENYIRQNEKTLSELIEQTTFVDILQSVGITIGEVGHKNDHVDLGLFNWYFNSSEDKGPSIYCDNNNLFSPSVSLISQSPELKKQLWHVIMNNLL
jgi:hypothetical protein